MKNRILLPVLILGLLATTSVQAASYKAAVKKSMQPRLESLSVGAQKLDGGASVCGIGIQDIWNKTIVHLSEAGTSNGLQPGDEILSVNGELTSEEPDSYRSLVQQFEANDKLTVNVLRNEEKFDIEALCLDDSERFKLQVDMIQFAAKGKWQQCIDTSYAIEKFDGKRTLYSVEIRNTCTGAKRCGWKCKRPTSADARSLYEVNLTELEALKLANISVGRVETSVQNGINWLEEAGFLDLAEDLKARLREMNSVATNPVAAVVLP